MKQRLPGRITELLDVAVSPKDGLPDAMLEPPTLHVLKREVILGKPKRPVRQLEYLLTLSKTGLLQRDSHKDSWISTTVIKFSLILVLTILHQNCILSAATNTSTSAFSTGRAAYSPPPLVLY